jgi:hypothetical protein
VNVNACVVLAARTMMPAAVETVSSDETHTHTHTHKECALRWPPQPDPAPAATLGQAARSNHRKHAIAMRRVFF